LKWRSRLRFQCKFKFLTQYSLKNLTPLDFKLCTNQPKDLELENFNFLLKPPPTPSPSLLSLYLLYFGSLLPTSGENMASEFTLVVPGTPDHTNSKGRTGTPNHSKDKPKHINSSTECGTTLGHSNDRGNVS